MGSLAGKSPANTYKSLLKVADETNGVSDTISQIEDGEGTASSLSVTRSQLQVKGLADSTGTLQVKKSGGASILKVDTSNNAVLVGSSLVNATTQLLTFSAMNYRPSSSGAHMVIGRGSQEYVSSSQEQNLGTGTDPATSKDWGTSTQYQTTFLFFVPYNITIDACKALLSSDADTDIVLNVHLMSYDMVADGTTNDGNLSNGTVLADGQATAVDRNVCKTVDCTIQSSSVTSGKVILCTVENETNTDDIHAQVQVKYHIA
tara:strand:- start:255 stop:1037 length:783 start_codon:yes stop_codon:yes gene_type:complete